jgi:Domain of unknown function (DUF4905)
MKKKFEHSFEGKIWNSSFENNFCVIETRNEDKRTVSFSCINLLTGNILWNNIAPEKSWWLGIVGIYEGYLILHKYSSNSKPEPEGVLILDIINGNTILIINDWAFVDLVDCKLSVYKIQNNQPVFETHFLEHILPKNEELNLNTKTIHYPEDSPHFPTIYKFLYRLLNVDAVKAVDYLEISNKIIISYYIYRENLFQNYLLVTNREREILLHDFIAETEGIGIDTFTVQSDTLLYVKNENQFIGYEL